MNEHCCEASDDAYALDAAGQKVRAGDYVMASLPNVPATKRPRVLHPCLVLQVQPASVRLSYAGDNVDCRRWAKEPFLRWHNEVVKADVSALGLQTTGTDDACACRGCRYREEACDGD